jgi:UDP-glucose 4-epimerase
MTVLVTGSAGHLGAALVLTLREAGESVRGLDLRPSPETDIVASVTDRGALAEALSGASAVIHAATLHKPHVATHPRQAFVDVNITGTLAVLEAAAKAGVGRAAFTSTTSAFGRALTPPPGAPAAFIDEDVRPVPKNIYGVTKTAAEDIARLVHERSGLPIVVLRTSRFFLEADDDEAVRSRTGDLNHKVNELLNRRVDIEDVVAAHRLALERAPAIGFGCFVVSATTPLLREDAAALRTDAAGVVVRRVPAAGPVYARLGWQLPAVLDRVYDNARARSALGWTPRWTFAYAVERLAAGLPPRSALHTRVGVRPYHAETFADGPYPVEP